MTDVVGLNPKQILTLHDYEKCKGRHCSVHNPSEHPLKDAPLYWRSDRRMMERICEHGIGHVDPDHLAFYALSHDSMDVWAEGVHGCDGCCTGDNLL